ncbi:MAG: BatD family protein [Cytophagaceae bacterium]|jgi:uncharacterized membrane protein|nr:BatD family protein [Cytophagaceae bacterium]
MKHITASIFLLFLGLTAIFAQDATISAEAPRAVVQGSRFQLVYRVNAESTDLRVPDLADFQILMGPSTSTSTSMSIINGNVTRSVEYSFTYILRADKTGTFTIPSASIDVKGKRIESNRLVVEVIAPDVSSGSQGTQQQGGAQQNGTVDGAYSPEDLFVTVTANKSQVYQDEPVLLTTKIYTRVNLESISDIKNPDLKNFMVEEFDTQGQIQWSVENVNGKTYQAGILNQKVIYPQAAGKITIEPTSIEFMVRQREARQSRSIFDDFFESYRTVKRRVNSKTLSINVKQLPSPRPSAFSGVVGDITLNVTASKTDAKANDGITIKATVSGTGNLRFAGNPQIKFPADFDVFDPKISSNITQTSQGGKGSRTVETLIIPRHAGTFEIPAVEYSYFNPATGQYRTLRSNPITISVERGAGDDVGGTTIQSPAGVTRENMKILGTDIRFIKTGDVELKPINTFLFGSTLFMLGYIIPLVLFVLIFFINRKRIKENADIQKVKTKKANKVARKRLKKSAEHLKKDEKEAFYEELSRALWGYTGDKLSIPVSELTRDNAKSILTERGADETLAEDFLGILDTCEYARYAPQSDVSERDQLYRKAIDTISKLENKLR